MLGDKAQEGRAEQEGDEEICARAATLIAEDRSVLCAAADIASGKMALVPTPIKPNPSKAIHSIAAKKTRRQPSPRTESRTRATRTGL